MILVEARPDNEGPLAPVSKRPVLVAKQIRGELKPGSSFWIEAIAGSFEIVSKDISKTDREKARGDRQGSDPRCRAVPLDPI